MDSLDQLTIRGFKSIRELEGFELKPLNLFIGANGAGKSNLISFFRMLHALMEGNLTSYVIDNGGMSDLLFNGRDTGHRQQVARNAHADGLHPTDRGSGRSVDLEHIMALPERWQKLRAKREKGAGHKS